MGRMRTCLVIITLALLACLVVIGLRPDEPPAAGTSATSPSPSFEVRVEKPRSALPLFGLLPAELFGVAGSLAFNEASRGAAIGLVGHDRLELSAEGWDFAIEIDGEGRVAPGTRLVFPLELGGRQVTLRCRPTDQGIGTLRITTPADADEYSGQFLVELATCENTRSGKALEWPPAPLTVRGRFDRLPHRVD